MIKKRKTTNTFEQDPDTQAAKVHTASDPREKFLYDRLFLDATNQRFYTLVSCDTNTFYNKIPYNYVLTQLCNIEQNITYDKRTESIIVDKGTANELLIDDDVFKDFTNKCYARIHSVKTDIPFYNRYYVNNGDKTLNTWVWNGIDYDDQVDPAASKPFFDWIYFLLAGGLNEPDHEMEMQDYTRIISAEWADLKNNAEQQFYIICHWLADAYQSPLKAGETALLFTGGQNIGKSTLVPLVGRIIDKGFGRAMEAKVFLSDYDDDFARPGIIDISDTHEVPAYKLEASLRQKIRPSAASRLLNMKGTNKVQGKSHIRFITSSNDSDFVSMKKGETSRYHLIDCASSQALSDHKEKYEAILKAMKDIITPQEFDKDTFNNEQQEYLSSISMILDNIVVNEKACQSSSGYETELMINKINENLSTLKVLLMEKYKVLKNLRSARNKDFTRTMGVKDLYGIIIDNDTVTQKSLSLAAFKKMLGDTNNADYANYNSSQSKASLKIIPPEEDDEVQDENVVSIKDRLKQRTQG